MKKAIVPLFVFTCWCLTSVHAQETGGSQGVNKLLISGHAQISSVLDTGTANFTNTNFTANFLYMLSDKIFFQSEIEVTPHDHDPGFSLEHAHLVWMIDKDIAFSAGRFIPHFGLYRGRLGEGFINRFPSDPVGFGDGGIGPMVETGFGFQGGLPLGVSKMNYDLWVANGTKLLTDSAHAGQFEYEGFDDNNKNKAIGGRIGFLPFSNSCLEVGLSYETAAKTGNQYSIYQNVGVRMMAVDLNFYKSIPSLKSTFRITGECKKQDVDKAYYSSLVSDSLITAGQSVGLITGNWNNSSNAFYVSASIRPSISNNTVFRNFELAYRYSQFSTPSGAPWGTVDQYTGNTVVYLNSISPDTKVACGTVALDYWLKWNCVIKVAYQMETNIANRVLVQMFYGF